MERLIKILQSRFCSCPIFRCPGNLKIITPINLDLGYKKPMDIDLTGLSFSLALSYRF